MASIAVVAAAGRTGKIIVEQALAAGHQVTAIARNPDALRVRPGVPADSGTSTVARAADARLTVRAADVLRPGTLDGLLSGHDAVISALGSAGRGPTTVYSAGTASIAGAMGTTRRLIVLSSAGLAAPADAGPVTRLFTRLLYRVMRDTYTDMLRMEELLAATDLDWTAVRPTGLTDRPATGRPRASVGATQRVGSRTSRADLAAYILGHLDDPATFRTAVAVSS
ncbi:NAD(P)-dependent oxidoreductase [Sphaerisporangium fuscum]|uniref:NAD(P)-dependent oxidoreductase n=1 Tax=Sphaerisporangium fuscum TaxID=2835868 RepID=UPI001BDC4251|nr:NAD(P)H-binding protein [Sphaerisporangium fuscum]